MGKEVYKFVAAMESECPTPAEAPPKINYQQPLSSPYEGATRTIQIGKHIYSLPDRHLRQMPRFREDYFRSSTTILSDIQQDVAHTFVHFLYTGEYQTIATSFNVESSYIAKEYKRAISVYQAARVYELPGLESLAKHYIEIFGDDIPMCDMLCIARDVFSALPKNEQWLLDYIERSLHRHLDVESPDCNLDEVYQALGQIHHFDIAVMKMVVGAFSACLKGIHDETARGEGTLEKAKETLAACAEDRLAGYEPPGNVSAEEYPEPPEDVPEPAEECPEPEEEYPEPAEDYPELTKDVPAENSSEEFVEEPVEYRVETPEAEAEPEPEPEAETVETPVEEGLEEPQEPPFTNVRRFGSWKFRKTVGYVFDPHPLSDIPATHDLPISEQLPFQGLPTALVNLATAVEKNLKLYENWGSLTHHKQLKRKKRLRAKGLPVPADNGAISLSVGQEE
ncbi:hypothetical protein N7478_007758 [Penicillium angulare]|uniref:uncharacterized protein n=1 Tax=Penicillium angulare TaxID=116970 RepID=UPI0025411131|nr:uncharacterized protein N7478_007758 [Penicillium angulare]KAJ5272633.1 hypothetical protein N7478_007758 [Penicillium angulare]